ncbi:hypothetical protein EHQ53_14095 [Leptospira langatensis]|uniref:Terminase large subunit gp17-like C-terminal domain-containing protein n=1 Tax=Leptospira langatensis TaxID=2484983 RepID=A0ABY2MCA5_9LEPT|nr:hypothetical protein [Leptospira langatensis]TGL39649.1 hypothetical protein EHQ53_14095 [Leptospira langatensis]
MFQKELTSRAKVILQKFREKPHLLGKLIGYDKLSDIHSEWIKEAWLRKPGVEGRETIHKAARGSYKSVAIVIVGGIWYHLFKPDTRTIIFRKTHTQASEAIAEMRKGYESDNLRQLYWDLFGIDNLEGKKWSDTQGIELITKTKPTKEPSFLPRGIDSAITGYHCERLITDDIVTILDRYSKKERTNTITIAKEFINIIERGTGKIVYNGTPWHKDDLFSTLPPGKSYSIHSPELLRAIPDYTPEDLSAIKKRIGISLFAANYELKHIADENRLFNEPVFHDWVSGTPLVGYLDPSYSGENHTALTFVGPIIHNGQKKIQARGFVWDKHVGDCYSEILRLLDRYKVGTLWVEENADQGQAYKDLARLRKIKGLVRGHREKMNKHARIVSFVLGNWDMIVFPHDVESDWLNEVMEYVEGEEPDDAPDSFAGAVRALKAPRVGQIKTGRIVF